MKLPKGYTELTELSKSWDVGHVFRDASGGFGKGSILKENFYLTVKPGETAMDVWRREFNEPIPVGTVVAVSSR